MGRIGLVSVSHVDGRDDEQARLGRQALDSVEHLDGSLDIRVSGRQKG
jgi:hypothetical protein